MDNNELFRKTYSINIMERKPLERPMLYEQKGKELKLLNVKSWKNVARIRWKRPRLQEVQEVVEPTMMRYLTGYIEKII